MSPKKLLVADDSPTIQKVIRLALSGEGYDIQSVSNSSEALEKIPLLQPDIVLIDVSLPEKNAFEVKATLASQVGSQPQYVLMSRAFEKVDEARAVAAGFLHRLVIPFDPAQLRDLLQQIMHTPAAASSALVDELKKKTALPMDSELLEPSSLIKNPSFQPPPFSLPKTPPPAATKQPLVLNEEKSEVTIEVVNLDIEHQFQPSHQASSQAEVTVTQDYPVEEEILSTNPYYSSTINLEPTPVDTTSPEPQDAEEDDIQQLTRKTIEMSSLDQQPTRLGGEWSIDESGAKSIQSHIQKSIGDDTLTNFKSTPPTLAPYSQQLDLGKSSFPIYPSQSLQADHPTLTEDEGASEKTMDLMSPTKILDISQMRAKEAQADQNGPQVVPLSHDQMQRILSDQMRSTLEEMAREILPDIAERVIKQEIHKMLAENPNT